MLLLKSKYKYVLCKLLSMSFLRVVPLYVPRAISQVQHKHRWSVYWKKVMSKLPNSHQLSIHFENESCLSVCGILSHNQYIASKPPMQSPLRRLFTQVLETHEVFQCSAELQLSLEDPLSRSLLKTALTCHQHTNVQSQLNIGLRLSIN